MVDWKKLNELNFIEKQNPQREGESSSHFYLRVIARFGFTVLCQE